jgi:histidinol phosphatase-like PHP family hydrolase
MPPTAPRPWRQWPKLRVSAYFGVADRSKSAHYPGGLSVDEIAQQHREADRLNKRFGKDFRILKGIESDILADGSLDYENDVLEGFDFVVACIHGRNWTVKHRLCACLGPSRILILPSSDT